MAEDNAAKEAASQKPAPSGGKPILLIALLVINMGVMAFVGFMVHKSNQAHDHKATIDEVVEGEKKQQVEDVEKAEKEFVGKTIPMETFLVNLSGEHGRKLLKVNMELEVEGEKIQEEIEKRKPAIRDIIITLLSSKTYGQVSNPEGKEFLREEVRDTVNSFLTKGKIKQVLFTEFLFN